MSESTLLGLPRSFSFRGKVYQVAPRDFFAELAFADWVEAEAGLALARMKPRWPAEFYTEQAKIFNGKLVGKQIRWGSEDVHLAIWSEEGQRQLLFLKMKRGEEHGGEAVERDLIDTIANEKDKDGLPAKYTELIRIMMEQDFPFLLAETTETKTENPSPPASTPAADSPSTPKA